MDEEQNKQYTSKNFLRRWICITHDVYMISLRLDIQQMSERVYQYKKKQTSTLGATWRIYFRITSRTRNWSSRTLKFHSTRY